MLSLGAGLGLVFLPCLPHSWYYSRICSLNCPLGLLEIVNTNKNLFDIISSGSEDGFFLQSKFYGWGHKVTEVAHSSNKAMSKDQNRTCH
jgi:hypothetical protein